MSIENIIRAWKDEDFRASLSEAERKLLPENPAGDIELSDADLRGIVGGEPTSSVERTLTHCPVGRV